VGVVPFCQQGGRLIHFTPLTSNIIWIDIWSVR